MALPEEFEERGFLGEGVSNSVGDLRAENPEWFQLADDVNASLMGTAKAATESVKTEIWAPEAVVVRALLRACGLYQGVILLAERGMLTESRTLARSLVENAFSVAALHDNPKAFIEMLKADSEASRQRQRKFIVAEELMQAGAALDKLQTAIADAEKVPALNIRRVAELGPFTKEYLSYQRLSDDSAHLTARSLHRYAHTDEVKKGWHYKWSIGGQGETSATLYHATLAALGIGVGVTQMIKDADQNAAFGELCKRFNDMADVPVI